MGVNTVGFCFRFFALSTIALATCSTVQSETGTSDQGARNQSEAHVQREWLDKERDISERVNSLLKQLTLEEKIGQLSQSTTVGQSAGETDKGRTEKATLAADIVAGRIGSVLNESDAETIRSLQRLAVERSRLGIPLIIGRDVIHGFRTIFPIPVGQAASWNPELVEAAAAVAAREARSIGIHWTFSPMVDIARDPRWGRIAEGFGEDPCLASELSSAMVRGYQGRELSSGTSLAACAKHFAGYGAAEGGRDYNGATMSESTLRNVYLPPFHAAVRANVATLMTSFNELNGVPGSANAHLLQQVLRKEWDFQGFVVSDWESIREMIVHGYCADEKTAAERATVAGVNMEMVSQTYRKQLPSLMAEGRVSEAAIDGLVAGVLRIKFELGLFENPYGGSAGDVMFTPENLEIARKVARESVVLLKNEGELLPLDPGQLRTIAVIGPLADDNAAQLGCWSLDGRAQDSRTLLAAIRESAGENCEVLFASGLPSDVGNSAEGFANAVSAAKKADVIVLVLGESASLSGEAHSRADLDLPGAQNALLDAVAAVDKPIVLVVQAGRPLTIGEQAEKVGAILYSFHGGTMAGPAIADLLWGTESPSGKLPVTFPKDVGQVPLYYNHTNTGRPPRRFNLATDGRLEHWPAPEAGNTSTYIDVGPYPLYPFGFGLSYTTFSYDRVQISSDKLRVGESIVMRVGISNKGAMAADEIAQLYVHQRPGRLVRPVRELKGFRRVHLKPGERKEIEFSLTTDDLAYFDNNGRRAVDEAEVQVFVGGDSLAPEAGTFQIVK